MQMKKKLEASELSYLATKRKRATSQKNKLFLVETAEWFSSKGAKHKKHYINFGRIFLSVKTVLQLHLKKKKKKRLVYSLMIQEEIKGLYILYTFH